MQAKSCVSETQKKTLSAVFLGLGNRGSVGCFQPPKQRLQGDFGRAGWRHRSFPKLPPQQPVPELWGTARALPWPCRSWVPAQKRCWCSPGPPRSRARNNQKPQAKMFSSQATARHNRDARRSDNPGPTAAEERSQPQTAPQQDWYPHQRPQARHVFLLNHSQACLPQLTCVWGVPTCLTLPDAPGLQYSRPPTSEHSPDTSSHVGIPWCCPCRGCAPRPGSSYRVGIAQRCPCWGRAPRPGLG